MKLNVEIDQSLFYGLELLFLFFICHHHKIFFLNFHHKILNVLRYIGQWFHLSSHEWWLVGHKQTNVLRILARRWFLADWMSHSCKSTHPTQESSGHMGHHSSSFAHDTSPWSRWWQMLYPNITPIRNRIQRKYIPRLTKWMNRMNSRASCNLQLESKLHGIN